MGHAGDEHVSRGVRDHDLGRRLRGDRLRRHPAGPEHRQLSLPDLDRIPVVGIFQVPNPQRLRLADVDGRSVYLRHSRRHRGRQRDKAGRYRTHGDDERTGELAGGGARHVGAVHGHVGAFLDVAQRHARRKQRVFERETAPDQERHEVLPPQLLDIMALFGELSPAVDTVAGQVGPKVGPGGCEPRLRVAGIGGLDQGARLRVAPAEAQEVEGVCLGQNNQVRLHVLLTDTGGGAIPPPRTARFPGGFRVGEVDGAQESPFKSGLS